MESKLLQPLLDKKLTFEFEEKTIHQLAKYRISMSPSSSQIELPIDRDINEIQEHQCPPSLMVYCLGQFQVYQNDELIQEWPSSKGKIIFKYLVTHRRFPVPKEILMELFWSGAQPDAARNNLNVSIYGLRQALRSISPNYSHILFQDESYLLNPEMNIWIDVEELTKLFQKGCLQEKRGKVTLAISEFRAAEALYQGEFLAEDRYEDWIIPLRRSYQDDYQKLLGSLCRFYLDQGDFAACVTVCNKMITIDPCCEEAHRRLMRCYALQGQPYLALRQFHLCEETLRVELNLSPSKETQLLFQKIQKAN